MPSEIDIDTGAFNSKKVNRNNVNTPDALFDKIFESPNRIFLYFRFGFRQNAKIDEDST